MEQAGYVRHTKLAMLSELSSHSDQTNRQASGKLIMVSYVQPPMSWYLLCSPTKFTNGLIPTVLFVLAESLLYPNTVPNTQENSRFAFHAQNNPSCINPNRKLMLSLTSIPSYLRNKSMFNTQVSLPRARMLSPVTRII